LAAAALTFPRPIPTRVFQPPAPRALTVSSSSRRTPQLLRPDPDPVTPATPPPSARIRTQRLLQRTEVGVGSIRDARACRRRAGLAAAFRMARRRRVATKAKSRRGRAALQQILDGDDGEGVTRPRVEIADADAADSHLAGRLMTFDVGQVSFPGACG